MKLIGFAILHLFNSLRILRVRHKITTVRYLFFISGPSTYFESPAFCLIPMSVIWKHGLQVNVRVHKLFPLKPRPKVHSVQPVFISFSTQDPNKPSKVIFHPKREGDLIILRTAKPHRILPNLFLVKSVQLRIQVLQILPVL